MLLKFRDNRWVILKQKKMAKTKTNENCLLVDKESCQNLLKSELPEITQKYFGEINENWLHEYKWKLLRQRKIQNCMQVDKWQLPTPRQIKIAKQLVNKSAYTKQTGCQLTLLKCRRIELLKPRQIKVAVEIAKNGADIGDISKLLQSTPIKIA